MKKIPAHLKAAREAGKLRARMQGRAGMPGHRDLTDQYRLLKRVAMKGKGKKAYVYLKKGDTIEIV